MEHQLNLVPEALQEGTGCYTFISEKMKWALSNTRPRRHASSGAVGARVASFIGFWMYLYLEEYCHTSPCKAEAPVAMAIANLRKL